MSLDHLIRKTLKKLARKGLTLKKLALTVPFIAGGCADALSLHEAAGVTFRGEQEICYDNGLKCEGDCSFEISDKDYWWGERVIVNLSVPAAAPSFRFQSERINITTYRYTLLPPKNLSLTQTVEARLAMESRDFLGKMAFQDLIVKFSPLPPPIPMAPAQSEQQPAVAAALPTVEPAPVPELSSSPISLPSASIPSVSIPTYSPESLEADISSRITVKIPPVTFIPSAPSRKNAEYLVYQEGNGAIAFQVRPELLFRTGKTLETRLYEPAVCGAERQALSWEGTAVSRHKRKIPGRRLADGYQAYRTAVFPFRSEPEFQVAAGGRQFTPYRIRITCEDPRKKVAFLPYELGVLVEKKTATVLKSIAEPVTKTLPLENGRPRCASLLPRNNEDKGIVFTPADLNDGKSGTISLEKTVSELSSSYNISIDEKKQILLHFPPLECQDPDGDALELFFRVGRDYGRKFLVRYGPVDLNSGPSILNWWKDSFFFSAAAQGNVFPPGENYLVSLILREKFKKQLPKKDTEETELIALSFTVKPVNDPPYKRNPIPPENLSILHLPNISSRHLQLFWNDYFGDDDSKSSDIQLYAYYVCRRDGKEEEISGVYGSRGSARIPGKKLHCGDESKGGKTFLKIWGNDGQYFTEAVYREVSLYGAVKRKGKSVTVEVLVEGDSVEGKRYCGDDCTGFINIEPTAEIIQYLDRNIAHFPPELKFLTLRYSANLAHYEHKMISNPYLQLQEISLNNGQFQNWENSPQRKAGADDPFNIIINKIREVLPFSHPEQILKRNNRGIEVRIIRNEPG